LLDSERGITLLRDAACQGSKTGDVTGDQANDLIRGVKLVTVTVGGNDLDFAGLGAACAGGFTSAACAAAVAERRAQLPALAVRLVATYRAIAARAPRATILVTGYPALVSLDPVASATRALNSTIRSAVEQVAERGVRIRYVDVETPFQGHGLDSADPWFVPGGPDVLHPTSAGYRAYREALLAAL
jgi:lysophospholipase L1-like esterase